MRISCGCHCKNISLHWIGNPNHRRYLPVRAIARSAPSMAESDVVPYWSSRGRRPRTIARLPVRLWDSDRRVSHLLPLRHRPGSHKPIQGHLYAVVSVNAFEGVPPSLLRRAAAILQGRERGYSPRTPHAELDCQREIRRDQRAGKLGGGYGARVTRTIGNSAPVFSRAANLTIGSDGLNRLVVKGLVLCMILEVPVVDLTNLKHFDALRTRAVRVRRLSRHEK